MQAEQIRALIAGTLAPDIDPAELFRVDLTRSSTDLIVLPEFLAEIDVERPAPKPGATSEPRPLLNEAQLDEPARTLWEARRAFFALSEDRRAALLEQHTARQNEARELQSRDTAKQTMLAALHLRTTQLRAFLAGELDLDVDVTALLAFDLLDEQGIARASARRQVMTGGATKDEAEPETGNPLDDQLRAAYLELDQLLRQYVSLTDADRGALFESHEARVRDRDAANRTVASADSEATSRARLASEEQTLALAAARDAATEAERLVAEERARLHGVQQRQSLYEADLDTARSKIDEIRDRALKWNRRVTEVIAAGDRNAADRAYDELVFLLTEQRSHLSDALDSMTSGSSDVPSLRSPEPTAIPSQVDSSSLDELRDAVRVADERLRRAERSLRWGTATGLRDGVVALNRDRLRLLPSLTGRRRGELQGFGPEGVAQVRRELSQIQLELRYHFHALPRIAKRIQVELGARPLATALVLVKLLLLLFGFRLWRTRSGPLLERTREARLARRPQTKASLFVAASLWYAQRIRAPLEWLLLFWLIGIFTPDVAELPELFLLWIIAAWILLGAFAVRLVDAMAARRPSMQGADETARLRYRSLRLIGVAVVAVGLLLSMASSLVGHGAIYTWVWRTCWVLAAPIILILLRRWKPVIFERAAAHPNPNLALRWTLNHQRGLASLPATAVGGVVLLAQGFIRYALRQAAHLAVTRRFLAHLFRREVEKHAAARADDGNTKPLPAELYARLAPGAPTDVLIASVAANTVTRIATVVREDNNALIAVVGERGLGKTRFMQRVVEGLDEADVCWISCLPGGFAAFLVQASKVLGLPADSSEDAVVEALHKNRPAVICVDDAQRLIRPLIGGLKDIDNLVSFAHRVGPTTSWMVAIGAPAWQYLRRARGERAVFDEVAKLAAWDEHQIRELIAARAAEAHIAPKFDELVVPRQVLEAQYDPAERTERDYCQILWDYADGNPTVALHFWRESLVNRGDAVYVRLFQTPSVVGIEGMPGSLHFVLRAILQMELATEADIIQCTGLNPADVVDALRAARTRHYIEDDDGYRRIALPYFRSVTGFLRRQHLLVA